MQDSSTAHAPGHSTGKAKAVPSNPKNEAEFLKRQSDNATVAMNKALDEAKANFAKAFSLKTMARKHPLATVAAGLLAGFATGAAVTTSQRDSALKRLAEIERALNPQASVDGKADGGKPAGSSIASTLLKEAFTLAKPILSSSITAMIAAQRAASTAAEEVEEQQGRSQRDEVTQQP